ncbi:hypothetical protein RHOSPDRAFT_32721 [Rhodotorula sp. JG-1b]|nr:hypothetical protein RHOSPDRAFT_32721 [Rhodotorula sp. JG-1b]
MKAGAFGRQPERRQVQPNGRVLPGMFVAPPAAAAAAPANKKTASTSPPPPGSSTSSPKGSRKQEGVLSRWDSGGQGSGRLPPTTTSRLDRTLGTRSTSPERPTQSTPPVDSIARARRLGLNRAPRTPPPPASESSASDDSDEQETPVPLPNQQSNRHVRTRSRSSPSPTRAPPPARQRVSRDEGDGDRRRGAERTSSPHRQEPSKSDAVEGTAPTRPAPRPLPGLLSSLWNRASELVAGNAPAAAAGPSDEAASSSNKPGAEGEEEGADEADKGERSEADTTRRGKRPARPVVVPALVAPALAGVLPNAKIAPAPAKSSAPSLPPPEPITYHRPPALHPRLNHEESPRFRSQPTPYDWLDARDESRLLPYMFLPTAAQAAAYEARVRAQANKAADPHAAAAAVSVPWPVAAPTSSAPPQAQAPLAASLNPSPMAIVAASMPARGLQPERPTEARRAASDYGQQAPSQPPRERIRPNSESGAPLAAGGLALGAVTGSSTATLPPLVQSAFASPPTSEPARSLGAEVPAVTSSSAPVAPVSATLARVPAPAPAFGFNQAVPFLAAAPAGAYAGAAFSAPTVSAPPDEYLPRYTETEQAPRPASPATHPTTTSAAEGSQASSASAATAGAGGTAGQTVASSAQPASEIPRAGLGGDSLPIHPSPAQYSAAAPSPAPVVPSYTSAPMGLAPAVVPWVTAPMQTASSGSGSGNAPTSGIATSAPADTTTAPSSQAPPPSLPPLVPPASFPALQSAAAPCVPLPMVTSYPASFGNPAVPQDPQLPSLGPAALLRGAKTALKRAVLAMDPGADDFTLLSRRAQLGHGTSTGEARPKPASKDDLPPMPKPRRIPVSPPPPSDPITSSRSSSDLPTTPLTTYTQRPHIHSAYVAPVATPLPGAVVAAASMPIIPTRSTLSRATKQSPSSSPALSESANAPRALGSDAALPVVVAAQKGDTHATASVASSSPSTASVGTSCSSPATTLPAMVTPPPPPPVPVKSPSLTLLSPPPVPRRPASIPPLPEASSSATSPTFPSPHEQASGQPEASPEEVLDASALLPASAPAGKPRIELQTLDLDLPDFGVGFSLATPSEADVGRTISQIHSMMEERVTSYSIAAPRTLNKSDAIELYATAPDSLDDAFEETTTFVAGFAQASLLRAGIDPNHTGRTEKWLEQMGFPDSFFRPFTAPPASIAPEMTQRLQTSSPPPAGLGQSSTSGLVANSDSIGSPLETSIGAIDAGGGLMRRGRAHAENVTLPSVGVADFEPLIGDKGETASEVAAMFAHW